MQSAPHPPPPPAGSYPPFIDPSITSRRPSRVVVHLDMDCFYAQVESQRHPHFLHRPLGVVQNGTLCVTTNYHCRGRGLPKMGAPADFAALCPEMRFAGSDMVRYRRASREWHRSFCRWKGVVVMKRSIDEAYLDLTAAVRQRIKERHLLTPLPHSSPVALQQIADQRHALAIAAYKADEKALIDRYGPLEPHLLESSGTIKAAVRASKSTDPITQLREQQRGGGLNWEESSRKGMTIDEKVRAMSEEQIAAMLERLHPTDYCRAQKAQVVPIELVRLEEAEARTAEAASVEGLKCRPWVGEVLQSGEEDGSETVTASEQIVEDEDEEAEHDDDTLSSPPSLASAPTLPAPSPSTSAAPAPSATPLPVTASPTFVPPPTDFTLEDPLNPSDDYLLCVGSQLAYEIRSTLFYDMGLTTSAGIAPNMMLAKLASSHNKPNQQSIVRRAIARDFIAPFKLSKISGFGPKANERVLAAGVVTVSEVQARTYASLVLEFGEKFGSWLYSIGQAEDETPVEVTGPPKSIGQSKRQKTQTEDERLNLLYWLASKLYERIEEDEREYRRFPTTLALGFINMGTWDGQSRRQALPYLREKTDPVQLMYEMAIQLLKDNVPAGIPLRCLSLTVSSFVPLPAAKAISSYFSKGAAAGAGEGQDESKEPADGAARAVPLTAHPTIGPSFTSRYKDAKAKVKEKVGGGRRAANLFVLKEKVRRIDDMRLVKHALHDTPKQDEVSVQEVGPDPQRPVPAAGEQQSSDEDEINALFGSPDETSLASAPASLSSIAASTIPAAHSVPVSSPAAAAAPSPVLHLSPVSPAASSPSPDSAVAPRYVCSVCAASVPESGRAEHVDFHYAQQLQATVRADDRKRREEEEESRRRQRKDKQQQQHGRSNGRSLENYVRKLPAPLSSVETTLAHRKGGDGSKRGRDIVSFFDATPT